jgi:hypothetical protein
MRGLANLFMYYACGYHIESINLEEETKNIGEKKRSYYERTLEKKKHWKYAQGEDNGEKCSKYPDAPTCNLFSRACTDATFAYLDVHECHVDAAKLFPKFDYVIFNCGHHPASSMHYTFSQFESAVTDLITFSKSEIFDHKATTEFFWVENTAQPLRADHFIFDFKDWRTYHRLFVFDSIAKSVFKKMNFEVKVVPAFHSTLALFDKMCDCAHYPASSKTPQLLSLLDALKSSTQWI